MDPEVVEGYADDAARREPYLRLSSNDKLYNDIRNANIVSVGRILQQKSIRVGEMEAMKPDERTSSVQDIQDFLTKVGTGASQVQRGQAARVSFVPGLVVCWASSPPQLVFESKLDVSLCLSPSLSLAVSVSRFFFLLLLCFSSPFVGP